MQLGLFNGELFSLAIQITYIIQNSLYGYGETHFFLVVIIHDQVTYVRLYPKEQWAIHRKVSCLIREKQRWSAHVNRLLSLFLSLFLCDVVKKINKSFSMECCFFEVSQERRVTASHPLEIRHSVKIEKRGYLEQ